MSKGGPKIVGGAEIDRDTLRWEKKAAELEFEALSNVRGAAEKWAATLTALLGLVGTVAIIKGPTELGKLSEDVQDEVGILLALAFAAALCASLWAALAAQGTPRDLKWPNGPALRKREHDDAKKAKRDLLFSRVATVMAVVLIAAAVGVAWTADPPKDEGGGATVLFTPAAGPPLCGSLVNGANGLELEIGEEKTALPAGPYDNVLAVDGCPEDKPDEGQ